MREERTHLINRGMTATAHGILDEPSTS
jgi:hypothetical protein